MGVIDRFIDKFFNSIKKKQADRIIKDVRRKDKDLASKMDRINNAYSELEQYMIDNYGEE